MHQQIRELIEQSRVEDRGYFIYQYGGPTGHQSVEKVIDLEKFANSIIEKCIIAAQEAQADFWVVSNIKSRFGIE